MDQRRLERSATNRVVAGVCGGVAEYLAVDATLVRAFFVIATILTAFAFVLVYIVLLILMPLPGHRAPVDDLWPGARTDTPRGPGTATPAEGASFPSPSPAQQADDPRNTVAIVLIGLGFVFLLGNMGAFRLVQWGVVWPLALVALGVLLLVQRTRP